VRMRERTNPVSWPPSAPNEETKTSDGGKRERVKVRERNAAAAVESERETLCEH
jgi:hypothetical protein